MQILVEGDKRMFNQYGIMLVNPEKHPNVKKELGQQFIDWVISPEGQKDDRQLQDQRRAVVLSERQRSQRVITVAVTSPLFAGERNRRCGVERSGERFLENKHNNKAPSPGIGSAILLALLLNLIPDNRPSLTPSNFTLPAA